MTGFQQVWSTNEKGEVVLSRGTGTKIQSGNMFQDYLPTDDWGRVPVVGPFSSNGGVVVIGDSRTEQNTNTGRVNKNAHGFLTWAQALSKKASFWTSAPDNLGKSGDRTDQMLARIPQLITNNAGIAVVWGGVNDISQQYPSASTSGATAFANLQVIVNAALSSGKKVVLVVDTPVTSWTAAQRTQYFTLTRLITNYYSNKPDVILANFAEVVIDPTSSTLQVKANYYSDASHINIKGAYYCGKLLASIIDGLLPSGLLPLPLGAADTYTLNPNTLYDNGCFITTTGGTVGTGASGTAPSGTNCSRASGTGTMAINTASRADGVGNDLVLTLTGNASDVFRVVMDVTTTRVVPGATYVGVAEISVTGATGLRVPKAHIEYNGSVSGSLQRYVLEDGIGGAGPDEDYVIRIQTEPLVVPANGETINWFNFQVRPSCNASTSAVIKIGRVGLERIA